MDRRTFLAGTAGAALVAAGGGRAWAQAAVPAGYPADYAAIIEGSRAEGRLLVYSSMSVDQWSGIIARFNALYPWISVETLDLGTSEIVERYFAETGSNTRSADMLVTGAESWIVVADRGNIVDYASPELAGFPEARTPFPGLYTFAIDPVLLIWNKALLPADKVPTTFAQLVEMVAAEPEFFRNRLTTYGADTGAYGYSANYVFARHHGEKAWEWFDLLGPLTRPERSSGPMTEKVTAGEYLLGYFCGSGSPWNAVANPAQAQILGWSFIGDGTPLITRAVGIVEKAGSPNAARLLLDVMLSREGQIGLGKGRRSPLRPDVTQAEAGGTYTYSAVADAIGAQNMLPVPFDRGLVDDYKDFIARWKSAFAIG